MPGSSGGLGGRVVEETILAVGTWIAGMTGLFVAFHRVKGHYFRPYERGRNLEVDLAWERLAIDDGPVVVQWLDWLRSFATFQFGHSAMYDEPVSTLFLSGLGRSLVVVVTVLAVGTAATLVLAMVVETVEGRVEHAMVAGLTYALQVVAPVTGLGLLFVLESHEVLPVRLGSGSVLSPDRAPGTFLLVGTLVALPMVGHAVRRVQRVARLGPESAGTVDLLGRAIRPLDAWVYLAYTVSSLVVVNDVVGYWGIGHFVGVGVDGWVTSALPGVLGGVVWCLALSSYGRNLWTAVRDHRGTDRTTGERVPSPGAATVVRTVLARRKVLAGAGLLGVTAAVALTGSLLAPPEVSPADLRGTRTFADGVGPGLVFNDLASLVAIAAVATAVALALGASTGLATAYLEATARGWPRRLALLVRVPADALLLFPVGFALGFAVVVITRETPPAAEVGRFGVAGGLVLAGYAFHAVYRAGRVRFDGGGDPAGAAVESLVAGVARVDAVVVGILFAVTEWAFLRPEETVVDVGYFVLSVGVTFHNLGSRVWPGSTPAPDPLLEALLVQAAVVIAVPVLGVVLLADGLEEAVLGIRASGTDGPDERTPGSDTPDERPTATERGVPRSNRKSESSE